jgi:serine protease AprX
MPMLPLRRRSRKDITLHRVHIRVAVVTLAVTLGVIALGAHVSATSTTPVSKLDGILKRGVTGNVRVIIRTNGTGMAAVRARLKAKLLKEHAMISAITAMVGASDLASFEGDSNILSVSLDMAVVGVASTVSGASTAAAGASTLPPTTLLAGLGLPSGKLTGKGVGVAVIDSGLAPNGDFGSYAFYDFTSPASVNAYDDFGHGTHVSGLIASRSTAYPGLAPNARLISLKVLDASGSALTSTVLDAIQFAITNRDTLGIDVINLSLGHPILEPAFSDPLVQAVEAASRAGIVVVVAAGNVGRNVVTGVPGYAGILSPGDAPSAITVGAVDTDNTVTRSDDAVPAYSSRGPTWYTALPKPDVVAPGQNLISDAAPGSTLFLELPANQVADKGVAKYFKLSGTSMSTAVTSGLVALMIEANRTSKQATLEPNTIKRILEYSATPLNGYDALTQGHGEINGAGAVELASFVSQMPARKQWWTAARLPAPVMTVGNASWPWSQTVAWDMNVVWGNGRTEPAWAKNVVWSANAGDTIVWGEAAWGDTIVWGEATWGDTIVWGEAAWGDTIVWGETVDLENAIVWGASLRDNQP